MPCFGEVSRRRIGAGAGLGQFEFAVGPLMRRPTEADGYRCAGFRLLARAGKHDGQRTAFCLQRRGYAQLRLLALLGQQFVEMLAGDIGIVHDQPGPAAASV